jgi:hypothetical protein
MATGALPGAFQTVPNAGAPVTTNRALPVNMWNGVDARRARSDHDAVHENERQHPMRARTVMKEAAPTTCTVKFRCEEEARRVYRPARLGDRRACSQRHADETTVVRPGRLERPTCRFGTCHSFQLNYGRFHAGCGALRDGAERGIHQRGIHELHAASDTGVDGQHTLADQGADVFLGSVDRAQPKLSAISRRVGGYPFAARKR